MAEKLLVITTGGTIDGADSDKGTLRLESDAINWIQKNTSLNFDYLPLFNKDSRLIDNNDRQKILDVIATADANVCLVTHGTFTICETGRFLKKALKDKGLKKRVLLVGAWVPFCENNSDAPIQMAFATTILFEQEQGVYVAMDNKLYNPDITDKVLMPSGDYALASKS